MKNKLLKLMALFVAGAFAVNAGAQTFTDGIYYIQNVGTGKWLAPGNSWETQASVLDHADYWKLKIVNAETNTYTLESVVSNGGNSYYLTGTYCDGGATHLYITAVDAEDGVYSISKAVGANYLEASNGVLIDNSSNSANVNAQWRIYSEDDMAALLATATAATPVDATYLMKDHNLSRNNRDHSSSWVKENAAGPDTSDKNAGGNMRFSVEAYRKTFNVYQELTNLPNGLYAVRVNGFYRQDGSDGNLPYLYANDSKITLPIRTGSENSMQAAAVSFCAGKYLSDPVYVNVTDGKLKIGVATTGKSCWTIFKNFHIEYYGEATLADVTYANASQLITEAGDDVAEVDLTSLLVNPGFEAADVRGWTNSGIQPAGAQGNKVFDKTQGNYYAERWHAAGTVDLNQTVAGLPAGIYKLSAYVFSDTNDAKLYANDKKESFSTSDLYSVLVEIGDKGAIKFGASCTLTNSTWICMDGFTLNYMNDLTYTLAEGKMSVAADNAQKEAAATFQAEKTLANYEAVLAAIRAAEASKVAYENLNAAIAKAEEIIASTNVYVEADKVAYQAAIDEAKVAYTDGSYDGTATMIEKLWNTDYQSPVLLARPFISSVWSDDNAVYTNNWSTEANNKENGSGMTVPFIEYWVADANSLGEKTIDAVIGGLEVGEYYELSALVRVRIKNDATEATGITMDVNGTSVNVCDGATCDDGAPFRYGTYSAIVKIGEDGNLTIAFNVAAENTISWLSFKDVKYTKVDFMPADEADYAAFNAARDAANAKVVGFLAGEYATYNNIEVIKALAAANTIDVTANNEKDAIQAATAAIAEDKWDVNETEMNAVYNGGFALCEQDGAMAGWRMSNNTLGGAYHSRAFVGDDRLKEFNETMSAAYLRFDGTNSNRVSMYFYGDTEGYTMPLKENTVYYVKVDFAGWGSTGKPLRLNVTGPEGFSAVSQEHKTSVNADKENKTPQQFYILFTTTVAGNYVINFQVPGADSNTHAVVVSNIKIYTAESATMNISDAKYSTFIAPFDVELPEGVAASKITGVEGNVLTEEAVEGTIPANTPVVLYSETPVSKTFYGQNIATAETYTAGLLTGVYNDTKVATGNYVLLRKKTTGHVGFYLVGETLPTIKANSCYLTVPASSAPMFSFGRGEGTTGIEDAELTNDNVVIYDLAGRRVEKMEKGIYIVNGRKVIR